jgi:hypothetical protein
MNLAEKEEINQTFAILKALLVKLVRIFQPEGDVALGIGAIMSFNQKNLLFEVSTLICSMLKLIFMYEIDKKSITILKELKAYMESMPEDTANEFKSIFFVPSNKSSLVYQ